MAETATLSGVAAPPADRIASTLSSPLALPEVAAAAAEQHQNPPGKKEIQGAV